MTHEDLLAAGAVPHNGPYRNSIPGWFEPAEGVSAYTNIPDELLYKLGIDPYGYSATRPSCKVALNKHPANTWECMRQRGHAGPCYSSNTIYMLVRWPPGLSAHLEVRPYETPKAGPY